MDLVLHGVWQRREDRRVANLALGLPELFSLEDDPDAGYGLSDFTPSAPTVGPGV
jgi:hypothetical protein